ncbi:carbohydrate-binding family 9-like protein [Candidatus Sumerlaeota bacterium]|nr:carbohydrate-binding family 9-like protein [Candidatus Sumerlaeota bacterium]
MPRPIALTLLLLTSLLPAQGPEIVEPITCPFTEEEMTIDGALTEDIWRETEPLSFFLPITHAAPSAETVGRVCWGESDLFVALSASDEDLLAVLTDHDSETYHDDVLEIFLMPGDRSSGHHFIEINALGTVADGHTDRLGKSWNAVGLRIGIALDGTLNDSTDRDRGWCLEVAIPFATLEPRGACLPWGGDQWLFHLARYDYTSTRMGDPELSSCAPLTRVYFHNTADWIPLRFE